VSRKQTNRAIRNRTLSKPDEHSEPLLKELKILNYIRLPNKPTYYINTMKTNCGKFNIRFAAVKVWNTLTKAINTSLLKCFKKSQIELAVLLFMSFQLLLFSSSSFFLFFTN